jgi:uncharacterized repeat protein (TIGR03803 family)
VTSAGVALDAAGNLYGTVDAGVSHFPRNGVVYKLDTADRLTILYKFPGPSRGDEIPSKANPGVVLDAAGNLYGATPWGGRGGMVYKVDTAGQETTLYGFPGAPGGTTPFGGVIRDSAGNLYGTTTGGGSAGWGVLYKVDAVGGYTVLYNFTDGADGGAERRRGPRLHGEPLRDYFPRRRS